MGYVVESPESRSYTRDAQGVPDKGTILLTVWDTEDEVEVHLLVASVLPALYQGLLVQEYRAEKQEGPVWDVTAEYGRTQPGTPPPPGTPPSFDSKLSISFSTAGGTTRLTQSISTKTTFDPPSPDEKGAIGVTDQGVEGIDVNERGFEWTETHSMSAETLSGAYLQTLKAITWTTNRDAFRGFLPGEVLFKGASGTWRTGENAEIGFTFEGRFNRPPGLKIGDITLDFEIKGHEYIDVRYKNAMDTVGGYKIKVPQFVYVHQIYEEGNFELLGIGV
jgi:hypothetical protein